MRAVDLALYADALAGEAAALQAKAERARSLLRQAAIERHARVDLRPGTVARLEQIGMLSDIDELGMREPTHRVRSLTRSAERAPGLGGVEARRRR